MSELPKGWVNASLGDIANVQSGVGFPKKHQGVLDAEYPVYKVGDVSRAYLRNKAKLYIAENSVSEETMNLMKGKVFNEGSVLFAKIGEALKLNRRVIVTRRGLADNNVMGVTAELKESEKYIYRYLQYFDVASLSRSTTVPSIRKSDVEEILIPLAPLNEQVRIGDKLDSMLEKVDSAQTRLVKIPSILKRFRQSVLTAATSGELTKEWRKENKVLINDWESVVFSELSREITVGFVGKMSDKYKESGIPFLRSQNVRAFRFDSKNLLYIDEEFHNKIYKSRLEKGDLAVVRSGAPGTTCVIPESLGVANCSDLVIVRPNERLLPEYGCIYMNSSIAQKNVNDNKVGVAQQHFNVGSMKVMPINLPSIVEQEEIVRRVESLFTMANTVEKQFNDAKARTNRLTQSILAKAFRGELVPQDENDEPATKLLEKIKAALAIKPVKKIKKKAPINKKTAKAKAPTVEVVKPEVPTVEVAMQEIVKTEKIEPEKINIEPSNEVTTSIENELTLSWSGKNTVYVEKAVKELKNTTFTLEQFKSVTDFPNSYEELKNLILTLVKGIPGSNEPLFEIADWDEKTGNYSFKIKD